MLPDAVWKCWKGLWETQRLKKAQRNGKETSVDPDTRFQFWDSRNFKICRFLCGKYQSDLSYRIFISNSFIAAWNFILYISVNGISAGCILGKMQSRENVFRFALFVSFFPQLLQGPIGRYDRLADQLYRTHSFSMERIGFGAQRILWGYFKSWYWRTVPVWSSIRSFRIIQTIWESLSW